MVKFEKQVAIHKISHFFKTTQLVIFFHCNNQKYFHEKLIKSFGLGKKFLLSSTKEQNIDSILIKNGITKEESIVKLVKNNYAKKALLSCQSSPSLFSSCPKITPRNFSEDDNIFLKCNKKDKINNFEPLLEGNNILLGFKKVRSSVLLPLVKDLVEDDNINILGGIYKNCVIDHNQIKRLLKISRDSQVYENLNNNLQKNSFTLINNLTSTLNFNYLLHPHYRIILLLKSLSSTLP